MLQSTGLQRVGHNLVTEQQQHIYFGISAGNKKERNTDPEDTPLSERRESHRPHII